MSGVVYWLSKDPIGIAGGLNLYAFVGNNPVNFTDPSGLQYGGGAGWVEAGGAARDVYDNARSIRSDGHQQFPGPKNSSARHENGSYELAKAEGVGIARGFGILNEIQGFLMHDIPNLVSRLRGDSPWAFQLKDLIDNEKGINRFKNERDGSGCTKE